MPLQSTTPLNRHSNFIVTSSMARSGLPDPADKFLKISDFFKKYLYFLPCSVAYISALSAHLVPFLLRRDGSDSLTHMRDIF